MSNMGIIVQYYTCSSDSSMYNRIPFLYVYIPIRTEIYIHIIYTVYTYMCVCVNMLSFLHALDIQAFNTLFLHIRKSTISNRRRLQDMLTCSSNE